MTFGRQTALAGGDTLPRMQTESPMNQLQPLDRSTIKDMQAIHWMLEQAGKRNLQVEVVLSFGRAMNSGQSVDDAVAQAMREWDL